MYQYHISFVKFVPKYFILFDAIANEILNFIFYFSSLVYRNAVVLGAHKILKSGFFSSKSRVVILKEYFVHLKAWDSLRPATEHHKLAAVLEKFLVSGNKACDLLSPDKAGLQSHGL